MTKQKIEQVREQHEKSCKILCLTLAVLGLLAITAGYEYSGLVVHILGLYLVELV